MTFPVPLLNFDLIFESSLAFSQYRNYKNKSRFCTKNYKGVCILLSLIESIYTKLRLFKQLGNRFVFHYNAQCGRKPGSFAKKLISHLCFLPPSIPIYKEGAVPNLWGSSLSKRKHKYGKTCVFLWWKQIRLWFGQGNLLIGFFVVTNCCWNCLCNL